MQYKSVMDNLKCSKEDRVLDIVFSKYTPEQLKAKYCIKFHKYEKMLFNT